MKKFLMIALITVSGLAAAGPKTPGQDNSQKCDCVECKKKGWCVQTQYDADRRTVIKTKSRIGNSGAKKAKAKSE